MKFFKGLTVALFTVALVVLGLFAGMTMQWHSTGATAAMIILDVFGWGVWWTVVFDW